MTQKNSVAAVVVVYNTRCDESSTLKALKKLEDKSIKILVYDNSTRDFGNREYCQQHGWIYLGGEGNNGISKAYNACIEYLKAEKTEGILCLFDDDTDVDISYFDTLLKAAENSESKIFVPLIYAAGRLISPCRLGHGHRVTMFENEAEALSYSGNDLSAINSGMAIDLSVFDGYRYDENIFLDGVDHNFMTDMRQKGVGVTVFEYRCNHAFSGAERPSKEAAHTRFGIYSKDYAYILKDDKLSYLRLVGKRAIKLCIQYKTFAFLRMI